MRTRFALAFAVLAIQLFACIPAQAGALMAEVDWEARKKQKAMLTELLTRHLLTLDSIQAVGGETPPEVIPPSVRTQRRPVPAALHASGHIPMCQSSRPNTSIQLMQNES